MMRLGSPLIALTALTNGRPYHIYDHSVESYESIIEGLKKDIKKKERLIAVEWDNEFEERVSGRLLSVSSSIYSITEINETKQAIYLRCEHPNEKNVELSFQEFATKFRLSIKQKTKQNETSYFQRDFSEFKSSGGLELQLERHFELLQIDASKDTKSAFLMMSQAQHRLADYRDVRLDAFRPQRVFIMLLDEQGNLIETQ